MTEFLLHDVTRTVAPEGFRRDRAVSKRGMGDGSEAKYDFDTLFYEVIRQGTVLHIVAPRLLNFGRLVNRTRFSVDGRDIGRPKVRNFYRHSILRFANVPVGPTLTLDFPDGQTAETPIRDARLDFLEGLDCELILSKNDDLNWIADHLRFHVATQGVEGLVFIDNGSTRHSVDDLRKAISDVGLKKVALVSMPYPFGPLNRRPRNIELYLQTAAYNLARLMFLQRAGGALCMDVDEILVPDGTSIFDRARASRFGFVTFGGLNRYPDPHAEPPFRFTDHAWSTTPPKDAPDDWCIVPTGPLGKMQWRCHNLENNLLRPFQRLKQTKFYHCLGITTGWKNATRFRPDEPLQKDEDAARFWEDTFGPTAKK